MAKRWARAAAACLLCAVAAFARGQTATRPFSALRATGGAAAAAHALIVELAPREALSGVRVHLVPAHPPPADSKYVVWINGVRSADADGAPDAGATDTTLALPPQAFVPGINSIQVALVPRTAQVTGGDASTHAALMNDVRSSITLDFAGLRPNAAPTLAQLPLAFDARSWLPRTVTVDLGRGAISPERLGAAALAVEGIAARMREVDVDVQYRSDRKLLDWPRDSASWGLEQEDEDGADMLLVGTRSALSDLLPESVARTVSGPFIGIYPARAGKAVIVVLSGNTDADCLRAAQAFADTSATLAARSAMTIDSATAVQTPATRMAITLAEADPALMRAALNFAALHARATGAIADVAIDFSADASQANYFFGQDSALSPRLRRELPAYPPLQPGQVVSVPGRNGPAPRIALLGISDAAVSRAVDMLRRPAAWSLFMQRATLFDTRADSAVPLALARRSPIAEVRLFLADPVVFWSILTALLFASFVFLNAALKAQVAERLAAAGKPPFPDSRSGREP
ncbi:cellulose biosynthesis cyclic di-GMP-binding regulatory protein BcsB [Trinickia symbiotica]|uniref:cellulose biosynthesis cyclic di-GMP-binding regulatory protein BcsB n=1 Tax=Trinickia symbiotica TaxID=863227 RepID=UPI0015E71029|nr:cellulose biosynthesis cyclic di-GMP-binding regulatory protein BcsB [Trinickia symbiotica]